ncbi:MAG: 50S ribosomal protein L6 [Candidatus Methanomethyliaceae archaeon]|nr:50S ribosomal protein L6 [Candidatus Methanomethyliaceae archaeon]MCX8169658.1 50S ribosomal protein L6 [Candidatus Methanomethyliaceae archaeon]MDW7970353.1 50S ribosomal protein L6 [Nitrososphaerota archaeon]
MTEISNAISVPDDVKVTINGRIITLFGPRGSLTKDFSHANISIEYLNNKILLKALGRGRRPKALIGTIAAHIENMIKGVKEGHIYRMKIVYAHFPINVKIVGREIHIENFMGERDKRIAKIVGDVKVTVRGDEIIIEGLDKEAVGQTAANIHLATHIKKMDPRVFQDGIYLVEKR